MSKHEQFLLLLINLSLKNIKWEWENAVEVWLTRSDMVADSAIFWVHGVELGLGEIESTVDRLVATLNFKDNFLLMITHGSFKFSFSISTNFLKKIIVLIGKIWLQGYKHQFTWCKNNQCTITMANYTEVKLTPSLSQIRGTYN